MNTSQGNMGRRRTMPGGAGNLRFAAVVLAGVVALACSSVGRTAPIYWTDWLPATPGPGGVFLPQGTITTPTSSVTVTYSNSNGIEFYQPSGGIDYWVNGPGNGGRNDVISPYTSAVVDNSPTGSDIIALNQAGSQTLQFSRVIANPVFAFVSLNFNGYAFLNQDFNILSVGGVDGNACGYWGCGGVSKVVTDLGNGDRQYALNSNNLGGVEPHGVIQFTGAFDTLTWESATNERWNGFTVGVQGVTEEVPGFTPGNPILPTIVPPSQGPGTGTPMVGTFVFVDPPPRRWFDPPVVEGFSIALSGGGTFIEVIAPPGFDNLSVVVGGVVVDDDLDAGESFLFGTGVSSFDIVDISPLLDPDDPGFGSAFPLYLDFTNPPGTSMTWTPIAVPEPATWASLGMGLVFVGLVRSRRHAPWRRWA